MAENSSKQPSKPVPPPSGKPQPMPLESVTKGGSRPDIVKILQRDRIVESDRHHPMREGRS